MRDSAKKLISSLERLPKFIKQTSRVFWAIALGVLVSALVLARFAPKASLALAGVFTSVLAFRFWAQRRGERLLSAADRGDVEALRKIDGANGERFGALVALAVFQGSSYVASIDHTLCDCGECPMDGFDADLAAYLAALRKVEAGGSWKDAATAVLDASFERGEGFIAESIAAARAQVRLAVMQYMLFRSGVPNPSKTPDNPLRGVAGYGRALRAPLLFAAASHAKRRGDLPMARELLAKLLPWKPGSRLAEQRAKLERTIVTST